MMNTILGLLAKGEINCAGENIMEQQDMFAAPTKAPENDPDSEYKPRPIEPTTGFGKVKTAEEKAREAADEQRRKEEEEEEQKRKEEEEAAAKAKKGPSLTSKLMKWLGTFTEPDE
jgi:cell division protein FtsA